jgi:hypothetical protein
MLIATRCTVPVNPFSPERALVPLGREVDDVERVVGRVGDVEPAGPAVDGGVVEAARGPVRRQVDMPGRTQRHPAATCRLAHA